MFTSVEHAYIYLYPLITMDVSRRIMCNAPPGAKPGMGANQAVDAVYPMAVCDAEGKRLDGDNDYLLHFAEDELPPVEAFWSVTMYDAEGFQAGNEINRFAIGDRDALRFNADGSLDIYMQHENPGGDKTANWLPAPRGPLGITMRLPIGAF